MELLPAHCPAMILTQHDLSRLDRKQFEGVFRSFELSMRYRRLADRAANRDQKHASAAVLRSIGGVSAPFPVSTAPANYTGTVE